MHFKIKINIFHSTIEYFIGEEEIEEYIKKTDGKDKEVKNFENSDGCTTRDFIWLRNKEDLSVLVHENYHVIHNLKKWFHFDDEELEAYMSGYLFEQCVKKLKSVKKSK